MDKNEEKEFWYRNGFNDAVKACYAAFAISMHNHEIDQDTLVDILQDADNRMNFFIGEEEMMEEAFKTAGILLDFKQVFSEDKITKRMENAND